MFLIHLAENSNTIVNAAAGKGDQDTTPQGLSEGSEGNRISTNSIAKD